jgi:hypothetical protein
LQKRTPGRSFAQHHRQLFIHMTIVSAITQFGGPVFMAFDGLKWGSAVPTWSDFPIPVPAHCGDAGKRNWEFGTWAPVSW